MLAQYVKNIGYTPLVIDCFCDQDTQVLALDCKLVKTLALEFVKVAFFELNQQYTINHFVYGSGFERYTNSLKFLQQELCVLGNSWEVFSLIQDKSYFFSKLKQLKIPFPEISFQRPDEKDGWLIKPMQGEGGIGIKIYQVLEKPSVSSYWQKYQDGIPMSVLFVANGSEYEVIGFNQQLFSKIADNEFVFTGVINQPEVTEVISEIVIRWLDLLVSEYRLKGINSLDFIVNDDNCFMLEVNARPSASLQLYDRHLFTEHIASCIDGRLSEMNISKTYHVYQVFFADIDIVISEAIKWPLWVVDIPQRGSLINTGMPICSIIACGKNDRQVEESLLLRQQIIKKLIQVAIQCNTQGVSIN